MADITYWFDELQKEVETFQQHVEKLRLLVDSSNLRALELQMKDCEAKAARIREVKKSFSLEVRLIRDRGERANYEAQAAVYEERFNTFNKEFEAIKNKANKKNLLKESATTFGFKAEGKDNDQLLGEAHKVQDLTFESLARSRAMIEASKEVGAATIEQLRGQRDQIKDIEEEVDKIDSNLMRAEILVRNFTRRMATDRIIQLFTAFNIVVMLSLILYVAISGKSLTAGTGGGGGNVGPVKFDPTPAPTFMPNTSAVPSVMPSFRPSTLRPSFRPSTSFLPTVSIRPTRQPTSARPTITFKPSRTPTIEPTVAPTFIPTGAPSFSHAPTQLPTTESPTFSVAPTVTPTAPPSESPSPGPTVSPTPEPTVSPTPSPTTLPTEPPSQAPTVAPA